MDTAALGARRTERVERHRRVSGKRHVVSVAATPYCQFLRHADVSSARRLQVDQGTHLGRAADNRVERHRLVQAERLHAVEAALPSAIAMVVAATRS